jgi:hypothetical protein
MEKRFVLWNTQRDGEPRVRDVDETASGVLGQITENNVYLTTYASYPDDKRPADLEVGERIRDVIYRLSGQRGVYDVYRVR